MSLSVEHLRNLSGDDKSCLFTYSSWDLFTASSHILYVDLPQSTICVMLNSEREERRHNTNEQKEKKKKRNGKNFIESTMIAYRHRWCDMENAPSLLTIQMRYADTVIHRTYNSHRTTFTAAFHFSSDKNENYTHRYSLLRRTLSVFRQTFVAFSFLTPNHRPGHWRFCFCCFFLLLWFSH